MAAKKRDELFDLIPAYVLGALDDDEHAEIEAWLQTDPEAQAILTEYETVADHLVALAPLRVVPDHLQADLRERLAADRSRDQHGNQSHDQRRARARRGSIWTRVTRRRWMLAAAAAVAALLTVVLVGVRLMDDSDSPDPAERLFKQIAALPDATKVDLVAGESGDEVWGYLIIAPDGEQAVLCLWDLPTIAPDQTFQMWLVDRDGTRTSGGLFQDDTSKKVLYLQVPFDQPVTAYQGVGVSLEPAGGSPYADQPTGPRVLSVPLG